MPSINSRATRLVSSCCRVGTCGMTTAVSRPCFSTCGGRPGEKTRSLMPSPLSSIAMIIAAANFTDGSAGGSPKSDVSRSLADRESEALTVEA